MELTTLLTETTDDGIGIIRLHRPEALNALNSTLVNELAVVLTGWQSAGLRAVILTGSGRAFAAGADISEMSASGRALRPDRPARPGAAGALPRADHRGGQRVRARRRL
jgi:enoyl-CoA hydratase/carnithine racemase